MGSFLSWSGWWISLLVLFLIVIEVVRLVMIWRRDDEVAALRRRLADVEALRAREFTAIDPAGADVSVVVRGTVGADGVIRFDEISEIGPSLTEQVESTIRKTKERISTRDLAYVRVLIRPSHGGYPEPEQ